MGFGGMPVDVLLSDSWVLCVFEVVCVVAGVMMELVVRVRAVRVGVVVGVLVELGTGVLAGEPVGPLGVFSYMLLLMSCIMASSWDSNRFVVVAIEFVGDMYARVRRMVSSVPSLRESSTAVLMVSVSMKVW